MKPKPPDGVPTGIRHDMPTAQALDAAADGLSLSDLNSALMAVFARKAAATTPAALLKRYAENLYTASSSLDPIAYLQIELDLLARARAAGMEPVLLSPAAPLGTCSAVAPVSQNKIISALRGAEIVSDPTNVLTLHLALGLREKRLDNTERTLHYCCTHRCTRVQASFGPGQVPHFGLFGAVASGRDTGSYAFEHEALTAHIGFYAEYFRARHGQTIRLHVRRRGGYPDAEGFFSRTMAHLTEAFPELALDVDAAPTLNAYYAGLNVKMYIERNGKSIEIGDMGFVDWTRKLLGNSKERLLVSSLGLDRLLA